MVTSSPTTNGDDDLSRPSRIASTGPISLGSLLGSIQHELLEGEPPLEFAVASEPWGTLAFRPGDVMAIAAPPGMGKSALISQLLDDAQRLNPLAISLTVNVEMTVQTMIERKILETVGGGCVVPMAVYATAKNGQARVLAEVLSLDGKRFVRLDENISLQEGNPLSRAEDMGIRLMKMGGRELVDEAVKEFGAR